MPEAAASGGGDVNLARSLDDAVAVALGEETRPYGTTPGTPARAMCTNKSALSALPLGPGGLAIFPANAPREVAGEI